ncbi:MAG TPA: trypsin-like peptidase domain-containing protein [Mycobacteriales bacterium]|nr:trypsin-like peptidase domain-containing protein [Mycobacteriales bacterium]
MTDHGSWPPPPPMPPPAAGPPPTQWPTPPPQWWGAPQQPAKPSQPSVSVPWNIAVIMALLCAVLGGAVGGLITRNHGESAGGNVKAVTIGATTVPTARADRAGNSVAAVASRILPSVVSIQVKLGNSGDTGSGIVLSRNGYIMTNNHVISAAKQSSSALSVILPDKSRVHATVVGEPDIVDDIAVVKVAGVHELIPAALGNSDDLAVGDTVVAVGSPLGLAGTVTSGIVSALNRPVEAGGAPGVADDVIDAIQTDAAINPGNSGGPLVDDQGLVVGVNSAIASLSASLTSEQSGSIGLGFAIPINEAKRIAEQIITKGFATHAIIGVRLDSTYDGQGARVSSAASAAVTPGGPAAKAGIKPGDIIVAVDGERITTADELIVAIRRQVPGSTIRLTYLRGGHRATVSVVLGSQRSS